MQTPNETIKNMSALLEVLRDTHKKAARRENASTQVLVATWESNGHDLIGAITAAMQTFGGRHAPIKKTYNFLESLLKIPERDISPVISQIISNKLIVWGFGSSFVKGGFDPMLKNIHDELYAHNQKWMIMWDRIRDEILFHKKNLFPNLAFFTAAVCIEEKIDINFCEAEMLKARIEEWIQILKERP